MVSQRAGRGRSATKEYVRDFLVTLVQEIGKIPVEKILDGASLDGDLQMESVAFIEIQTALEEEFDIEIDLLQIVELNHLAEIVDYLHELACRSLRAESAVNI